MTPVREWRIHLGAHKTATTHLQDLLAAMRPALAEQGVDFLPHPQIRDVLRPTWQRGRRPIPLRMRAAARGLGRLRGGPPRVALSEENLLGYPHDAFSDPVYPHAGWLRRFRRLTRGAERALFLSIRSYDGFLVSAFYEHMRFAPNAGALLAAMRARLRARPPSWPDLLARLRRIFPGSPFRIWRYEDYARAPLPIVNAYLGLSLERLPTLERPEQTVSPSAAAIAHCAALDPGLPGPERYRRVNEIYAAHPRAGAPFHEGVLSEAERDFLAGRYAEDCARLRQEPGLMIEVPRG